MKSQDKPDELDSRPRTPHDIDAICVDLQRRVDLVEHLAAQRKAIIPPDRATDIKMCLYAKEVLRFGNVHGASNPTIMLPEDWFIADILAVIGMPDKVEPSSDRAWQIIRSKYDQKNNASLPTAPSRSSGRTR